MKKCLGGRDRREHVERVKFGVILMVPINSALIDIVSRGYKAAFLYYCHFFFKFHVRPVHTKNII